VAAPVSTAEVANRYRRRLLERARAGEVGFDQKHPHPWPSRVKAVGVPPENLTPHVAVELRERLIQARRRGTAFPEAWEQCVGAVLADVSYASVEYRDWRYALEATRDGWARAYLDLPPLRREASLGTILTLLDA
jgi:hypothetical protein